MRVNTLGPLRVLLAEDNDINRLIAMTMLQRWGFITKFAHNGEEAVDAMVAEEFDIILMDIQMPVMDGIEAAVEIRRMDDEKKKNTPIIALTANALMGMEKEYFEAGMNGYLTKPFKEDDLYDMIEKQIKGTN